VSADSEISVPQKGADGNGEDGHVVDRPPPGPDKPKQTQEGAHEGSAVRRPVEGDAGRPVEEGGDVSVAAARAVADPPAVADVHQKPREHLMLVLAGLLCGMVAIQYIFLFVLAWNTDKKPDSLEKAFNVTLPVAAGLVSSIVTFYFTKKTN
jgi:hypothetical protein